MPTNIILAPFTINTPGHTKEISKIIDLSEVIGNAPGVKIFIVLQTFAPFFPAEDFINTIALGLKNSFASSLEIFLSQENFNAGFELALKDINQALYKLIVQKNLLLNEQNFHIALGGIWGRYIVLATRGGIRSVLFHKDQNDQFVLINIAGITANRMNAAKLFSQTVAGNIGEHDVVFIATPEIFDLLGNNNIKKTVTENNIAAAHETFKNELIKKNLGRNSSILIIKTADAKLQETMGKFNPSLNNPGLPSFRNIAASLGLSLLNTLKAVPPMLWKFLKWLTKWAWRGIKLLPPLFRHLLHPRKTAAAIKEKTGTGIDNGINKFNALPRPGKVALIILITIATISLQGIYFLNERYKIQAANSALTQKLAIIRAEKESGESSLTYGDKKTALELFSDAKNNLLTLSKNYKNNTDLKSLLSEIDLQLGKLNKTTQIDNPAVLAELPEVANSKYIGLTLVGNSLYAWPDNERAIYLTDESGKIFRQTFSDNFGFLKSAYVSGKRLIFSHTGNGLLEINTDDKTITNVDLGGWTKPIGSFAIFSNRLYITDPASGQIIKFSPTPSGFTGPASWLKAPEKIEANTKIAIDSKVYLLTAGKITEFSKGVKTEFALDEVSPAIGSDALIEVSPKRFYILDLKEKRLVVWDNAGKLLGQYISTAFDNLNGFAISADEKKAYFLNGNKIYGSVISFDNN